MNFPSGFWIVSISLSVGCLLFHIVFLILLAMVARWARLKLEMDQSSLHRKFRKLVGLLFFVSLTLIALHLAETTACAAMFVKIGAIQSFDDAFYYSLDTMATRGASGIALAEGWRLLGAVEAGFGVLLFGMSTAFMFAVMQADISLLNRRHK